MNLIYHDKSETICSNEKWIVNIFFTILLIVSNFLVELGLVHIVDYHWEYYSRNLNILW